MKRAKDLLEAALGRPELVRAVRALATARQWPEVVGPALGARSEVSDYADGTLVITCDSAAGAQEIRLRQAEYLLRLNELAREQLFSDIRVTVRPPRRPQP